jgi:uncharacterized protein YndB with AHSA1/START domain
MESMDHGVSFSREIAAPAERVWAMVANLDRMGEWSPENDGGRWVGGTDGPAVGAVFGGRNHNGWRRWRTKVTVIESDPPRRFAFRLRIGPLGGCDWVYDIESTDVGCRVTESWVDHRTWALKKIGWAVSGVADRATHNRATMESTLDSLAAEAI